MPEENQLVENHYSQIQLADNLRLIVIGASAGGFEALKILVRGLPPDFAAPIFIVWHMSPEVKGVLPQVLSRENSIPVTHAINDEIILNNHIYVAPPDFHLLIDKSRIRVSHGPKENRFRPAVDPLFRSAAYNYGNQTIGIILSGALGDGAAGLWSIKEFGGIAIVQDPREAQVSSMPESAMREVQIDHCVSVYDMPALLVNICQQPLPQKTTVMDLDKTRREIKIAAEDNAFARGTLEFGELTPYACPECHGVLSRLHDDKIIRYRCHTGHAYSVEALMVSITEKIEDSLYSALRGMDESIILLNHLGDHYAEINEPKRAAVYFQRAIEANLRSNEVRSAILNHQLISKRSIDEESVEMD